MSDLKTYDLSIISDQEAADRLGVFAAEREESFEDLNDPKENEWLFAQSEEVIKGLSANRVSVALDILALRKAQVALHSRWLPIETAPRDGTKVLLLQGDILEHGSWGFIEHSDWDNKPAYGWSTDYGWVDEPTHWLPALQLPKS